jgi:hypothetical protein
MNEWRDMAHDAGYRGEEADQAARMLEEQERERYERLEEDRRASDVPSICEDCGAPVVVYDALVDRMVPHDCQPQT